jgi:hypothetical protein
MLSYNVMLSDNMLYDNIPSDNISSVCIMLSDNVLSDNTSCYQLLTRYMNKQCADKMLKDNIMLLPFLLVLSDSMVSGIIMLTDDKNML